MIKLSMGKLIKLPGIALVSMVLLSCAAKGTQEIGDTSLESPETKQHYKTIYNAFTRHDTDGDGFLDAHEFAQLQTDPNIINLRQKIAELANTPLWLFNEIDDDGDEKISYTELTVVVQPLLPRRQ
ncbi:MAG TPA: EF-hand domain-containing protein [Gammaproteobacteria bacterium]